MDYFPICLQVAQRSCIVIGGGRVAERKVKSLLVYGARVKVISPELTGELVSLHGQDKIGWLDRCYQEGDLAGAFLVIAATDDSAVQDQVFAEAEKNNTLLNVADVPNRCNFILPATARSGDLSISVSTAGKSPALAGKLRRELESMFGSEYGVLLDVLGNLREIVLARGYSHDENKVVFGRLADLGLAQWVRDGSWEKIAAHIQDVLGKDVDLSCLERAKAMCQQATGGAI